MTMVAENQGKLNCFPPQFQHMSSEAKTVPGKKLKIIFKRLLDASEDNSSESTMINILDYGQADRDTIVGSKSLERNVPLKESMPAKSKKRRLEISGPGEKKQKLESNLKHQLRKVLKELMSHRAGPIFSEPVDPVKLKIPDYFSIITKPMDLGTILRKLDGNMYSDAKEFAADVRLTFSNAMLYNPLWHEVHKWAMTLDAKFNTRWKILEAKLENGKMKDGGTRSEDEEYKVHDAKQSGPNNHQHMKPDDLMKAALPVRLGTCGLMSQEEKQKVRLDTVQLLCKQRRKLLSVFQKFGLVDLNKERLDSYIASIDDETLFKLRREVKVLLSAKAGKVEPRKQALNGCSSFSKAGDKGGHRRSISSTESGCSSCVGQKGHRLIDVATQRSASDLSSERSAEQNRCGDSRLDHEIKYPSDSLTSPCGLGSDGSGGVISEADSFRLSTPASVEGLSFNVPMSPKKALRAAMLKKRFADTIFKATHQEYSDHNEKSDRLKLQQERERLEQEHREAEKAKIEAQIKAAEEASRRELHNLKMQRENERKAARIVFEMVEKSVEVDDNTGILTNLKMIGCDYLYYPRDHGNRLEQLGLYRKDEYLEEEEDMAILNVEEGEILS